MPTASRISIDGLVTAFNKVVINDFNVGLQKLDTGIFTATTKKYTVTPSDSVNYPFTKFAEGLSEKKGSRTYQTPSDAFYMNITNVEYDKGFILEKVKFERAQAAAMVNPLAGLNIQQQQVNSFQQRAIDHPIERAMLLLENGDASTYGVCFDAQPLFDTDHDYNNASGSQSNKLSGTGETLTLIHADVLSAIAALQGFTYAGVDSATRFLNPRVSKVNIICAPTLYSKFLALKGQQDISVSETNLVKGYINDIFVWPFTDGDDYYVIDASDDKFKPILFQEESPLKFTTPNLTSDSYIEEGILKYGANYRGAVAYGAWWKAVMVTNT